jgi:hypothetical protein
VLPQELSKQFCLYFQTSHSFRLCQAHMGAKPSCVSRRGPPAGDGVALYLGPIVVLWSQFMCAPLGIRRGSQTETGAMPFCAAGAYRHYRLGQSELSWHYQIASVAKLKSPDNILLVLALEPPISA